jgi:hypothetical protein
VDVHGLGMVRHDFVTLSVLDPSLTPTHPGGTKTVEPDCSSTAGPRTVSGCARGRSNAGPGRTWAVRTATSSIGRVRSA